MGESCNKKREKIERELRLSGTWEKVGSSWLRVVTRKERERVETIWDLGKGRE